MKKFNIQYQVHDTNYNYAVNAECEIEAIRKFKKVTRPFYHENAVHKLFPEITKPIIKIIKTTFE